jgi:hypothetical protein
MSYGTSTPDRPPLLASNDDTLAINAQRGEPKEFYADAQVLADANTALERAGSPILLTAHGTTISLAPERRLALVQPRLRDGPTPGARAFADLTQHICRDLAEAIAGAKFTQVRLGRGLTTPLTPVDTSQGREVKGLRALAHEVARTRRVGAAAGTQAVTGAQTARTEPAPGRAYGERLARGGADLVATERTLGLNWAARPAIGEGYTTQSITTPTGLDVDYSRGEPATPPTSGGTTSRRSSPRARTAPTRSRWRTTTGWATSRAGRRRCSGA